MMKKNILPIVGIVALLLGAYYLVLTRHNGAIQSRKRPNILLITVCSLRQDHLGLYGYSRNTSPYIDQLAQVSTVFNNCHTHIPWTKPSVIALMFGEFPSFNSLLVPSKALSTKLSSSGYRTCAMIGTNMVRKASKANVGFDCFLDHTYFATSKDKYTVQADVITNEVIKFLDSVQKSPQPQFLWVFFKDPHWPYSPPLDFKDKFLNDRLFVQQQEKLVINDNINNSIGGIGKARLKDSNGAFITDKAYYIAQYDAEILFLDGQIGRILEYLKKKDQFKDWVIVLLSDHGESHGEDGYYFDHGYKLSEATTRIPLIIKLPLNNQGVIIDTPVSISDIYPTILNMVGIRDPGWKSKADGIDLFDKSALRKGGDSSRVIMLQNDPIHGEEKIKLIGAVRDEYKLIKNLNTGKKTLYKISKDEVQVEYPSYHDLKIMNRISGSMDGFFDWPSNKINVLRKEELRSLGYMQ